LLNPASADRIYDICSKKLQQKDFSCRGLLKQMKVEVVCTTDDPADSLEHHQSIKEEGIELKVLPTFRPDKVLLFDDVATWNLYVNKLSAAADSDISDWDSLLTALKKRHDFFHQLGCRLSDHGLAQAFAEDYTEAELKTALASIRAECELNELQKRQLSTALMVQFGRWNAARSWTMQLHLSPMRNNSTRRFKELGPDSGFDSIGDLPQAQNLSRFLDKLDITDELPKTILYNLNPRDNDIMATMCGNFQDGVTAGKIQFGSGWWFLDQIDGMEKQMNSLSNLGLISHFVGMLTDSRSFLSFPRHEYFRRILCNLFGRDVERGLISRDMALLGEIIEGISYKNARQYFGFYN